jgi:hypothetical protein
MHGGVYVPVTEETQPNPYLSDVPERDLITPSGRHLTLINPAYMTRQVYELMKESYGVRGHITSLNPIRPENKPDTWETQALRAFESGKTEVSSIEKIEGKEFSLDAPFCYRKRVSEMPCKTGIHGGRYQRRHQRFDSHGTAEGN